MAELLRDNAELERRRGERELAPGESRRPRREVPDLLSWIQCFSSYAGIVARQHPEKTRELFAYVVMVVREARRCGGGGWREYDAMFRQLAATTATCDWSKLNTSIYAVSFLAQSSRGRMCSYCLEPDHVAEACALAPSVPRRAEPQGIRPLLPATTVLPPPPPRSQGFPTRRKSDQICFSWNEGKCNFPYCRYRHACLRCQGDHHSWQCRDAPVSGGPSMLSSRGPLGQPSM